MAISNSPSISPASSSDNLSHQPGVAKARVPTSRTRSVDSYHPPESRRSAGRPPEGQSFFNTLFHPFAAENKRRRSAKKEARLLLRTAMEQMYDGQYDKSHESLLKFVRHTRSSLLSLDYEMLRGRPSNLHPVEEILRAGDYDGLLVLAPALKSERYGAVYVNRTDTGFYMGEGAYEGDGNNTVFKARGHGILMDDGQRTEGEWRNNLPNGAVKHFPKSGPLRCYEGQVSNMKMHGKGRAEYTDGRVLRGTWVNNVRDGHGEMTWPGGDRLTATWRDGLLDPGAIFDAADGRRIEGEFDEDTGRPNGRCSITWQRGPQEGARYEGTVQDGIASGHGQYMFGAQEPLFGFAYEGPFFKGTKHGAGKLIELATEKTQRCHFINDELKTPMPQRTGEGDEDEMKVFFGL